MDTLVVDILNAAARRCSSTPPTSWLTSEQEDHVEIRDIFLPETVDECLDRIDWPAPISATDTLAGGSDPVLLPGGYRRLHRSSWAVYEATGQRRPCISVADDGLWQHLQEIGSAGSDRYFRLTDFGNNPAVSFFPEMGAAAVIYVSYVTNYWLRNGDTAKTAFTDAADLCRLPRRLVEAGIVYRFRERRGLPFADHLARYEAFLTRAYSDARAYRTIRIGGGNVRTPWDVPIPDFIPPAS